jgi:hypothetical protein
MRPFMLAALAAAVFLLPAAAEAGSGARVRGTVTVKDESSALVTVVSQRRIHVLRIPGSLAAIRLGQRVELRGTTLRRKGSGSRVLARGVAVVRVGLVAGANRGDEPLDDERELTGRITSLSPLTVAGLTCAVPSAVSLVGFRVGDVVEITCDLIGGTWTLRKIHREDRDEVNGSEDDRGGRDDDDDDQGGGSGSGGSGRG